MTIGFIKTLPKVKDISAVIELREFINDITDPKIQTEFLTKIIKEKTEVESLLAKNEAVLREQEDLARKAAEDMAEQETRLQSLIQSSNEKLSALKMEEKKIQDAHKSLGERENIIVRDEADLLERMKVFQKERDTLDETLASKNAEVKAAVDAANAAEARHNAAAAKLENKLARIEAVAES